MKFSETKAVENLKNYLHEISDLVTSCGVLQWDQEVNMPAKGTLARSYQLATLAGVAHTKAADKKFGQLIELANQAVTTEADKALVREAKNLYKRASKVPVGLVKEFNLETTEAFGLWKQAKSENNFLKFAPILQRVLEMKIQISKLVAEKGQGVYDSMMSEFEPGLSMLEVDKVFEETKPYLIKMASKFRRITADAVATEGQAKMRLEDQKQLQHKALEKMGYEFESGRIDLAPHPFCVSFGSGDVRITTWEREDFRPGFFATMHEAGHALYEQGVDTVLTRLYFGESLGLSGGSGLAMHEGQSRLWENMVGRDVDFLDSLGVGKWAKAVNVVQPGLIRVEADEVTYGLHVIIRYEIEKELVAGKVKAHDLPGIWNDKYGELLGMKPKDDAEGVLQDVHWAHGAFGYFPTYLLGSMIAAQIWKTFIEQHPKFNVRSDLRILREWLRDNIHKYGRVYPTQKLLIMSTGEKLNPRYYIEYLNNKLSRLFGDA
jgi:carboxypeptidase Taq